MISQPKESYLIVGQSEGGLSAGCKALEWIFIPDTRTPSTSSTIDDKDYLCSGPGHDRSLDRGLPGFIPHSIMGTPLNQAIIEHNPCDVLDCAHVRHYSIVLPRD